MRRNPRLFARYPRTVPCFAVLALLTCACADRGGGVERAQARPAVAPIFFGSYMGIVFFVLSNMFVAIVTRHFEEVRPYCTLRSGGGGGHACDVAACALAWSGTRRASHGRQVEGVISDVGSCSDATSCPVRHSRRRGQRATAENKGLDSRSEPPPPLPTPLPTPPPPPCTESCVPCGTAASSFGGLVSAEPTARG